PRRDPRAQLPGRAIDRVRDQPPRAVRPALPVAGALSASPGYTCEVKTTHGKIIAVAMVTAACHRGVAANDAGVDNQRCAARCAGGAISQWVFYDASGKLHSKPLSDKGDRIMDYSYAGYRGGGVALPMVPAAQTVMPSGGDDTASIQAALDAVATR